MEYLYQKKIELETELSSLKQEMKMQDITEIIKDYYESIKRTKVLLQMIHDANIHKWAEIVGHAKILNCPWKQCTDTEECEGCIQLFASYSMFD